MYSPEQGIKEYFKNSTRPYTNYIDDVTVGYDIFKQIMYDMTSFLRFLRNKQSGCMCRFRSWYWGKVFRSMGHKSRVLGSIGVLKPELVTVGENSTINPGCFLNAKDRIIIGNHVHISPKVMIHTGGLKYNEDMKTRRHLHSPVVVEDGTWIGAGAIINPGVTVGSNEVIGAGAVVTKNIPANCVAVGVPAKVIKTIS